MCKSMQWNDSEKQMTLTFLGLAEGDYKETFLFRRGDSLPLVHTTEQVRFFSWVMMTSAWYFLWGSVLSKSYHPPSDVWSTKFSLQSQAPAQCWQYTWLGAANERVNYTATCRSSSWCWCCGTLMLMLVIVQQGVGSEDNSVQLRLAFFQWSSRRWRGCSNQQTLLFAPGKDGQLKNKGSCQMSTGLGFFIRCGLKMTKMEQTNQTWTN